MDYYASSASISAHDSSIFSCGGRSGSSKYAFTSGSASKSAAGDKSETDPLARAHLGFYTIIRSALLTAEIRCNNSASSIFAVSSGKFIRRNN